MQPDPEPVSVSHVAPLLSREGQIRLVLQRLASGFYQRADVLHEVAERIFSSS